MAKGNQEALDHWATETAGGEAHFAWGTAGDFGRCVTFHEGKGLSPDVAKGHCANLHHRALGVWPGQEHKKGSTVDKTAHGYIPILKYDEQPDGTLHVYGSASDSGIDRDQQIADPVWLSKAMPSWFQSGGNIREQHDPRKAAGVAITYAPNDKGEHNIVAHVIDPVSVAKVKGKALKGFSFGARNGRVVVDKSAKGGRIVDGEIYEVSLVDRPANPRCTLTIAKADGAGDLQVVAEPELVEKTDEPTFTPSQFAELLKGLGKTPAPVPAVAVEKRITGVFRAVGDTPDPVAAVTLLSKADGQQVHDPNDIAAVRDGLIALIKAELDELAGGQNELMDVSDLLQALRMVMYWWLKEARGGETDNPFDTNREAASMASIELADGTKAAGKDQAPEADTTKTEQPATGEQKPVTEQPTEKTEGTKTTEPADGTVTITKSEVASLITDAITKAVEPYEERLKALGAELAEVKATPIPGGPARTRTPGQTAVTQKADVLRATVEHLEKAVGASSGVLQQGYRERLEDAQAELLTLEGSTTS